MSKVKDKDLELKEVFEIIDKHLAYYDLFINEKTADNDGIPPVSDIFFYGYVGASTALVMLKKELNGEKEY